MAVFVVACTKRLKTVKTSRTVPIFIDFLYHLMALNTYILSLLTEKWLGARNLYRWHEYQFNYGRINSSTISIHVTRETFKHNTFLVRLTNLESFVWLSSRNNLKFFHHYDGFFFYLLISLSSDHELF